MKNGSPDRRSLRRFGTGSERAPWLSQTGRFVPFLPCMTRITPSSKSTSSASRPTSSETRIKVSRNTRSIARSWKRAVSRCSTRKQEPADVGCLPLPDQIAAHVAGGPVAETGARATRREVGAANGRPVASRGGGSRYGRRCSSVDSQHCPRLLAMASRLIVDRSGCRRRRIASRG
jgi:hypothetical protein